MGEASRSDGGDAWGEPTKPDRPARGSPCPTPRLLIVANEAATAEAVRGGLEHTYLVDIATTLPEAVLCLQRGPSYAALLCSSQLFSHQGAALLGIVQVEAPLLAFHVIVVRDDVSEPRLDESQVPPAVARDITGEELARVIERVTSPG